MYVCMYAIFSFKRWAEFAILKTTLALMTNCDHNYYEMWYVGYAWAKKQGYGCGCGKVHGLGNMENMGISIGEGAAL